MQSCASRADCVGSSLWDVTHVVSLSGGLKARDCFTLILTAAKAVDICYLAACMALQGSGLYRGMPEARVMTKRHW